MRPHASCTGPNASQSRLSWEPWPWNWYQGISSLSRSCEKTSRKIPTCPSRRCRRIWSLPMKSEASACPSASCPSCLYCTGLATGEGTYPAHEPLAQPRERNVLRLGAGISIGAVVDARHLGDVGIELLYTTYELTYLDTLGFLEYIWDVVLFLLSCVDGKRSEKVKHDAVVKQFARHSPWAFQWDTL